MPARTLIIGLGTNGRRVAEAVADRIVGQYGKLERVPWLQFAVFDTQPVGGTFFDRRGDARHIGLDMAEFAVMKTNPAHFDPWMDFTTWRDDDRFQVPGAAGTGAGNDRMIGRACLMHPNNIAAIHGDILARLQRLSSLTDRAASDAYGSEIRLRTSGNAGDGSASIDVYVVGTLGGGTASGGVIDLGYLLRTLPGFGKLNTVGLLAIPPSTHTDIEQTANAYAALQELNHFSRRGARYRQKFALTGVYSEPIQHVSEKPFEEVFLVQTRSGQEDEYDRLMAGIGEFLFQSTTTDTGDVVAADLINPGKQYALSLDKKGNPQAFASLGVAVIEYPVEHIVRGCSARLAAASIEDWYDRSDADKGLADHSFYQDLKLSAADLVMAMLDEGEGPTSLTGTYHSHLQKATREAEQEGSSVLARAENDLDAGFRHDGAPDGPVRPGHFLSTIESRAEAVLTDRVDRLRRLIREQTVQIDRGPAWTLALVEQVLARTGEELEALRAQSDPEVIREASGQLVNLREDLDEARSHPSLFPGWRGIAVRHYADRYRRVAFDYYQQRVNQVACGKVERVYQQINDLCTRIRDRIQDPQYGVQQWARYLLDGYSMGERNRYDGFRRIYTSARDRQPIVNGVVLYEGGEDRTLDQEYLANVREARRREDDTKLPVGLQGEAYAKAYVVASLTSIGEELLKPTGESLFDRKPPLGGDIEGVVPRPEQIERIDTVARTFFDGVRRTDVVERLMSRPDWDVTVDTVFDRARWFVDLDDTLSPQGAPPPQGDLRTPSFAFYPRAAEVQGGESAHGRLRTHLGMRIRPNRFVNTETRHKIVFVRARSNFSVPSIKSLETFEKHFREAGSLKRRQSRRDVRWRHLDGTPPVPTLALNKGVILGSMALGLIEVNPYGEVAVPSPATALGQAPTRRVLSRDVEESAIQIEEYGLAHRLLEKIEERLKANGPNEVACRFQEFAVGVGALRLELQGRPLDDGAVAAGEMEELLRHLAGVGQAWESIAGIDATKRYGIVEETVGVPGTARPFPGRYCRACDTFLGKLEETPPERCPNPACRYRLRG
ncbi:MAG TPA: tubulin-like doman-containing protein [Fimbriimonas sp.]